MKILIKNSILISMDNKREKIEYGMDILLKDNKIIKIAKRIIDKEVDEVIDASNKIVMPGLINTHAHVPMSIFRDTLDGYNLQDWLNKKIWPIEDNMTEEDIYYASYLTFIEMIKTGSTMVNDMYFLTDNIIDAMTSSGVRMQTTRTLMDVNGEQDSLERLKVLDKLINKYKDNTRLTFNTGIHSLYTCKPKYVDRCIDFAKEHNINIHMHFCENSKEIEDIKNNCNDLPINILKNKFNNVKTILAHCVKLDYKDIDAIKDMNISISHCPISNLKLGCGIAKINYMQQNGINVSLGTDGQGTGANMDMFEVMKYTALLQKGSLEDPTKMNAYDVLKMATINGAKALGMENDIGSIEVGKLADIIIIDISSALTNPINDILSNVVYNVKGSNVQTTIIDGKILMKDRKLTDDIEKDIINKCESIIEKYRKDL